MSLMVSRAMDAEPWHSSSHEVKCVESDLSVTCRDDFVSLKHIGEGSMGSVTKVLHRSSGNVYALKAIDKQRVTDHNLQAQLLAEVTTQTRLCHPNLLRCYSYFEEPESVYIVLEHAAGGDLWQRMRKHGPLSQPDAAHVFSQVCKGVLHLHTNGVIHRDLKPENILLTSDMTVKICDFGWAAQAGSNSAGKRSTFCGTLCMLAPEMVSGKEYDAKVDVWAVGVLLYEMLTGSSPFDKGEGLMETCKAIVGPGLSAESLDLVPVAAQSLVRGLLVQQASKRMELEDCIRHPWVEEKCAFRAAENPRASTGSHVSSASNGAASALSNEGSLSEAAEPRLCAGQGTKAPKDLIGDVPTTQLLASIEEITPLPLSTSAASSSTYKGYTPSSAKLSSATPTSDACISPVTPVSLPAPRGPTGSAATYCMPRDTVGSAASSGSNNGLANLKAAKGSGSSQPQGGRESVSTVASMRSEAKGAKSGETRELLQKLDLGHTPIPADKLPQGHAAAELAGTAPEASPSEALGVLPQAPACTSEVDSLGSAPPRTQLHLAMSIPKTSAPAAFAKAGSQKASSGLLPNVESDSSDSDGPGQERPFGAAFESTTPGPSQKRWSNERLKPLDSEVFSVSSPSADVQPAAVSLANVGVPRVCRQDARPKAPAPRSPAASLHAGSSPVASPKGSVGQASSTSQGQASNGGAASATENLVENLVQQLQKLGFSFHDANEASKRTSSVEAAVGWLADHSHA
eukprot:TRINITY_DN41403_c0_g1_i1.p1 TRINITY_DN41403_c0_g1~~TRINITY_DN41403_c0_g1_i1.p1  ORF type:complete len:744 (+),score=137.00 TRINITY_DN41403_c0_g1_i1:1-2232(+)